MRALCADAAVCLAETRRYEASAIGYDAKAKRREILHAESRFLIARDPSAGSSLAGYVLCRFEVDEDVGGRKLAVVYWSVRLRASGELTEPATSCKSPMRTAARVWRGH